MSDFKDRLIAEREELDAKRSKLTDFIHSEKFASVDQVQQSLLLVQEMSMLTYWRCLTERINWLEKPQNEKAG